MSDIGVQTVMIPKISNRATCPNGEGGGVWYAVAMAQNSEPKGSELAGSAEHSLCSQLKE